MFYGTEFIMYFILNWCILQVMYYEKTVSFVNVTNQIPFTTVENLFLCFSTSEKNKCLDENNYSLLKRSFKMSSWKITPYDIFNLFSLC